MSPESAIWSRVRSLSAVTALVSTRVYLEKLPQSPTYPCVLVQLIDDPETYHLRGRSGCRRARVQIDALVQEASGVDARTQSEAIADAIDGDGAGRDASGVSGFIGDIGSPPFEIQGCFRIDRRRHYDPQELKVLTMQQDYWVVYNV